MGPAPSLAYRLLRRAYDGLLRRRLPRTWAVYNGVAVKDHRLLDRSDGQLDYKATLVSAVREAVRPGDTVVVVGGGRGVTSVHAAREAGDDGRVITYEAADRVAERLRETVRWNRVDARSEVRHGLVGPGISVYGETSAPTTPVRELPEHDVLVMDCEGAERDVLDALASAPRLPRAVVVESHRRFESDPDTVEGLLDRAGFTVVASTPYGAGDPPDHVVVGRRDAPDDDQ